jgi:hypothetical protein
MEVIMPPQGNPRTWAEASLEIAASPPVLWATFVELSKWPHWSLLVKSATCVSGVEWTLGAHLQLEMNLPFPVRLWSGIATLTEVQPAVAVSWETEYTLDVAVARSYHFKPTGLGTLVTIHEAYYGSWVWLYRLTGFPRQMISAFDQSLRNLKVYLEVGA